MAIELSNLTFTNQGDIVPASGVEPIFNTGIPNTLAGNDQLTGTWTISSNFYINNPGYILGGISGFYNMGTLTTAYDNDIITGIIQNQDLAGYFSAALYNEGTIDTGDGNDIITGSYNGNYVGYAIYSKGTINTGDGDDLITATDSSNSGGISFLPGSVITGNGNDTITGIGGGLNNESNFDTGLGDDIITGTGIVGLQNYFMITTSDGNDIITGAGTFDRGIHNINANNNIISIINTGNGNDTITGTSTDDDGIDNATQFSIIDTGDGNDIITGIGVIGIDNYGTINTGNGEDSIIAAGGFGGNGNVFLRNGKDYLKGFGSGNFHGGNGKDILELTSGSYTIGISGTAVNFTKGSIVMNTSEFEKLIAGGTTYNFSSLINGQTIFVA